jgi:hypothetical protein
LGIGPEGGVLRQNDALRESALLRPPKSKDLGLIPFVTF